MFYNHTGPCADHHSKSSSSSHQPTRSATATAATPRWSAGGARA